MRTAFEYGRLIQSRNTKNLNEIYLGPIYHPKFPISGYQIHKIKPHEQYRPDKIAYNYYGSADLHWVLDVVNNFYNGFSEYTEGTEIKVPTLNTLYDMEIIDSI